MAYLAVESEHVHTSEKVADLLWPAGNLADLDQEILSLRQVLDLPDLIVREKGEVRLNPPTDYWLDVAEFSALLARCAEDNHDLQAHEYPELCRQCTLWRQQAIALYRADFLTGLSVKKGSSEFDSWTQQQQDRLHMQAVAALDKLARYHEWREELDQAQHYLRRQLEVEPWREEAHQQLMLLLAHSGQRSAALAQYEICRRSLADEFRVEPSAETTSLYNQISSTVVTQQHNLPSQSTSFVGRQQELAEISSMLAHPKCHLLILVGIGGIGKTRLALQIAEGKVYRFLDGVWLVPLAGLESPTLLVTTIANALGLALPGNQEPKAQLLAYLRQKEMLLVLDNFEHLLSEVHLIDDILKNTRRK